MSGRRYSKGFRSGASTTQRLDGAVYSASNAALALAQLGDDAGALLEAGAYTSPLLSST